MIDGSGGDPESDLEEHRQPSRNELETAYEELETTNEELQSPVEELETTNEELQSTVEELETTNEELQSSNEELETMNGELESTNAELQAINSELRERTDEVERVNEFMESILRSVQLGVVVVDSRSRVKMWHGRSHELWGLDAAEVYERSIRKLDFGLPLDKIEPAIARSLSEPDRVERLVVTATNRRGRRIQVRILATGLPIDREDRGVILLMEELKRKAPRDESVNGPRSAAPRPPPLRCRPPLRRRRGLDPSPPTRVRQSPTGLWSRSARRRAWSRRSRRRSASARAWATWASARRSSASLARPLGAATSGSSGAGSEAAIVVGARFAREAGAATSNPSRPSKPVLTGSAASDPEASAGARSGSSDATRSMVQRRDRVSLVAAAGAGEHLHPPSCQLFDQPGVLAAQPSERRLLTLQRRLRGGAQRLAGPDQRGHTVGCHHGELVERPQGGRRPAKAPNLGRSLRSPV